jgi:hypothetical protein
MVAPELLEYEKQAVHDLLKALPDSNLPWRQPSFNLPTFWSKPLVNTIIRPVDYSTRWTNMITLVGKDIFTALVNGYVATTFGDTSLSDVEFRFVYNNRLVSSTSILTNAEHNKTSPTSFPCVAQKTFFTVRFNDRLQIQARNLNVASRMVICALYGWYFDDNNPAEKGMREGLTDV